MIPQFQYYTNLLHDSSLGELWLFCILTKMYDYGASLRQPLQKCVVLSHYTFVCMSCCEDTASDGSLSHIFFRQMSACHLVCFSAVCPVFFLLINVNFRRYIVDIHPMLYIDKHTLPMSHICMHTHPMLHIGMHAHPMLHIGMYAHPMLHIGMHAHPMLHICMHTQPVFHIGKQCILRYIYMQILLLYGFSSHFLMICLNLRSFRF